MIGVAGKSSRGAIEARFSKGDLSSNSFAGAGNNESPISDTFPLFITFSSAWSIVWVGRCICRMDAYTPFRNFRNTSESPNSK